MTDILLALSNTPVPTILVLVGILFVFLGLGGTVSKLPGTTAINRVWAGVLGLLLIVAGAAMHMLPQVSVAGSAHNPLTAINQAVPAKPETGAKRGEAQPVAVPLFQLRPDHAMPKYGVVTKMALSANLPITSSATGLTGSLLMIHEQIHRQQMLAYHDKAPRLVRTDILSNKTSTGVMDDREGLSDLVRSPLEGHGVLSEYRDNAWHSSLLDGEATSEQKLELADLLVSADRALPAEAVPVGHTWHMSGDELRALVNMNGVINIKGDAYFNLSDVVECGDHHCALIKYTLTFSGEIIDQNVRITISLTGDGTGKRSLKWFQDIEGELSGRMTMNVHGHSETDAPLVAAAGPFEMVQTAEIEF